MMSLRVFGVLDALTLLPEIALGYLPRITWGTIGKSSSKDSRLQELQQQIDNNNGDLPFMIDNGTILKAAPKKKMSYRRHRVKLYAPGNKQIQPLNNLVRCPACGAVKRSHFMCMNCFDEIKTFLKGKKREAGIIKETKPVQSDLDPIDERIIYPGKYLRDEQIKLAAKEWIPKREPAILYNKQQTKPEKRKHKY